MELSSDPAAAAMSQVPSKDDDDGDGDYESLPPHVSVATHMTAGAVAGILEHTVMYPVDSVKVTRTHARTLALVLPLRLVHLTRLKAPLTPKTAGCRSANHH